MNRESRPDDLDRIRHLEEQLLEQEELLRKTREEMLYFKREMLNREENYNQKFNRMPNVGVMQVIKPKSRETTDTKSRRPSSELPLDTKSTLPRRSTNSSRHL